MLQKKTVGHTFSKFKDSLLSLLYPPHCLHCSENVENIDQLVCNTCSTLLDLLNPLEHCLICFSDKCLHEDGVCKRCHQTKQLIKRSASCFEYSGPAAAIIKKFKYSNNPQLAGGIGAFMAAQFVRLEWPIPDLIVPVPINLTHWIDRGYNQSALIAEQLGGLLGVPVKELLKRKNGDFSQAGLSRDQRQKLTISSFKLRSTEEKLQDKTLLLIDDVYTTGKTLECCASALSTCFPNQIYSLTFCRALR